MKYPNWLKSRNKVQLLVFIALFTGIGTYVLLRAFAATPSQASINSWQSVTELATQGKLQASQQILEVKLTYSNNATPDLSIIGTSIKNGYVPGHKPSQQPGRDYKIEVLDATSKVIDNVPFTIPNELNDPPPLKGEKPTGKKLILPKVDFTLTLKSQASAKTLKVLDPNGAVITTKALTGVQVIPNTPNFQSVPGKEFYHSKKTSYLDKLFPPAYAATTTNTLDVTFIGDGYSTTGLTTFHNDVDRFITQLLAVEPYHSRASQITFHYIDNTSSLGCNYDGRLIVCNDSLVINRVNSSGVPYDKVVVIENNSTYGGSGGDLISVSYNGDAGSIGDDIGARVFLHETGGHSIGNLVDEYLLDGYEFAMVNCSTAKPNPLWAGLVAIGDYTLGCDFPDYYRSSPCSIMSSLYCIYFNAVSQKAINTNIDFYSTPYVNNTPPTGSIVLPADGAVVTDYAGTTITTSLNDDSGIARAELWKDGTLFQTTYEAPFSFNWLSYHEVNGSQHSLQVKAYDTAGNAGLSLSKTATVNTPPDTTPPSVRITEPITGSTVSGDMPIYFGYYDDRELTKIDFIVKDNLGNSKLSQTSNLSSNGDIINYPSFDTTKLIDGQYSVLAVATDLAGNSSQDSISVIVNNVDTIRPSTPTNLKAAASAYNKVSLSWTASSDNKGIAGYYIIRNGVTIKKTAGLGTSYIDSTVAAKTNYSYQVMAYDAASNNSSLSNIATATTPNPPDTQAPTAPTSLTVKAINAFQINLSWAKSTDNTGVTGYDVYRNNIKIATISTLSFGDGSVFASTNYSYYVKAHDAAGNVSVASPTVPIKTTVAVTGGILKGATRCYVAANITNPCSAYITIKYGGTNHVYSSSSTGVYQILGLPPKNMTVTYSKAGFQSQTYPISISSGQTITKNISLLGQY